MDAFQLNHSKTLLEITIVGGHRSQNEMEISLAVGKFVYSWAQQAVAIRVE